ncbi:MAG: fibrobacter succinogenes major paralogous domain-containing protein [Crocinitomicaceae bacterium]|nr:fibrobacter succinogenes major paralogous domain-containing protein [Crocinitomicaceae bacterium]
MKYLLFLTASVVLFSQCKKVKPEDNDLNGRTKVTFNSALEYGTMVDIDGNEYKTITIGGQTWMAENLRVTRYRNGEEIILAENNAQWFESNTDGGLAICSNLFYTKDLDSIATFGRIYQGQVFMNGEIAPEGWRMPTEDDYQTLLTYLGPNAANKLKEAGLGNWNSTTTDVTNESGFTAIPGGARFDIEQNFTGVSDYTRIWTVTPGPPVVGQATYKDIRIYYDQPEIEWGHTTQLSGAYVRLIKE